MKLRNKIVIFLIALLISFIGFNLIASPVANDVLKIGKHSGPQVVAKVVSVRVADCC
jgi:hypothetical protein